MAIFIDSSILSTLEDADPSTRAYYAKPRNQYWNEKYRATEDKDIFVFKEGHGEDTIRGFALNDKIRFVDFAGTFRDLTFAVDAEARTITIRYDGSGNQITLRKAGALIGPDGASLLTAANFHFVQTDEGVVWKSSDDTREVKWLEDGGIEIVCTGRERMQGGPGNDTLEGVRCPVKLHGGWGDDFLYGGWENDELRGGKGDDTLEAGYGDNLLDGGPGQDILRGGHDGDILYGGPGHDFLIDGFGNDILYGGKGDDTLEASWGDDELHGGRGDDILDATWGDNRLVGGRGNDTLDSGWGADTFVFREGDGHDTIEDFGFAGRHSDKEDSIELHLNLPTSTTEAVAFAGLQIEAQGDGAVIRYGAGDDTITLDDLWWVGYPTLDDFDFVFVG